MTEQHPFHGLILACAFVLALVVAIELLVLLARPALVPILPALLLGAPVGLGALLALLALHATGRRALRRTQQILAGDYFLRWHYAPGEWGQFIARERAVSLGVALLFLPILLGLAALVALLSHLWSDPILAGSLPVFLVLAAGFLLLLFNALSRHGSFARRARLGGDTYLSRLGIVSPDGYRALHGTLYHLVAVEVVPGRPSVLRLHLRLRRAGRLLALVGNSPVEWEVRVPVPEGHDTEAAEAAVVLRRQEAERT